MTEAGYDRSGEKQCQGPGKVFIEHSYGIFVLREPEKLLLGHCTFLLINRIVSQIAFTSMFSYYLE